MIIDFNIINNFWIKYVFGPSSFSEF